MKRSTDSHIFVNNFAWIFDSKKNSNKFVVGPDFAFFLLIMFGSWILTLFRHCLFG